MLAAVTQRQSSNMADWHMVLSAWPGPFRQLALRRNNSHRHCAARYGNGADRHFDVAEPTLAQQLVRPRR
jgi:hypothetical protein